MNHSNVAEMVDSLYHKRQARLEAQRQVDDMKAEEDELSANLLKFALDTDDDDLMGTIVTFHVNHTQEPDVTDWAALQAHIRSTGEIDLLEKRVMRSAVKQRWEMGNQVPGVQRMDKASVSFRVIK